jgi:hypothetical protein
MNNVETKFNLKNLLTQTWQGFKNSSYFTNKNIIKFNLKSLLKQSWQDYKQRPYFFSLVSLLIIALALINEVYSKASEGVTNPWIALLGLVIVIFFVQMLAGSFNMVLRVVNGEKPKFQDLLVGFKHIMRMLGVLLALFLLGMISSVVVQNSIVAAWASSHQIFYYFYVFLVLIGLVYMLLSLQFIFFAIIRPGFFTAFKNCWQSVRGYRLKLIWFLVVAIVFNVIGASVLGIGLLVTLPLSFLAYARIYQQLQSAVEIHQFDTIK